MKKLYASIAAMALFSNFAIAQACTLTGNYNTGPKFQTALNDFMTANPSCTSITYTGVADVNQAVTVPAGISLVVSGATAAIYLSGSGVLTLTNGATIGVYNGATVTATSGGTYNVNICPTTVAAGGCNPISLTTTTSIPSGTTIGPSGTLPVKFENFTAKQNGSSINLLWTTSHEINNKGFEIQRSMDGIAFSAIGFVSKANGVAANNEYQFIDANMLGSTVFYRLKQLDFDGKFMLSNVVKVNFGAGNMSVYPNPARSTIHFVQKIADNTPVYIVNTTGVATVKYVKGNKVDVNNLATGVYYFRVGNDKSPIKVTIQ